MSTRYDAIVIGAGHNGLVAAATLARAGRSVCVIEKAAQIGGMAREVEWDGARMPEMAHLLYNLSPVVSRELGLDLEIKPLPTIGLAPDGRHIELTGDSLRYADGAAHPEAAAFEALHARLRRFAALLARLADAPPPSLAEGLANMAAVRDIGGMARLGLDLKRLGRDDMREFLRIILSNAYDLVLDDLSDGPAAGLLAADAVRGAWSGPRGPGSVFTLLYRMGRGGGAGLPMGGIGAYIRALERKAVEAGAELRCGKGVALVRLDGERVRGVRLEDGSEIPAPAVLSSLGAAQTMALAGPADFDIEATRRLRNLRSKGTVAKLNLLLSGPPDMPGLSAAQRAGRLILAPSATHVERAFDPVKYGEASVAPVIEAVIPTLSDPSLCSDGRHILSIVVQYVPHAPKGGWTEAAREALSDTVMKALAPFMPGLSGLVQRSDLLTPADIETRTGAPGGHWHHCEMSIDQLLTVRPVNGMSRYAFGPDGLWLCGSSAHPGGDLTGAPGRNAARQVLAARVPA
ncbi:NAD(P)/FAD-dependent oxidoreductase [Sulfitobacter sp. LCG007]